jgi:hypothetical protein
VAVHIGGTAGKRKQDGWADGGLLAAMFDSSCTSAKDTVGRRFVGKGCRYGAAIVAAYRLLNLGGCIE